LKPKNIKQLPPRKGGFGNSFTGWNSFFSPQGGKKNEKRKTIIDSLNMKGVEGMPGK